MYTPKHLVEKILTSKAALEGERKQVTVLFADLKGSMELLADRDPEDARKLLEPILDHMMEAVHRYEGTVNQVMGDGIMALFGAPLAHEDHAVRACYAALRMQDSVRRYADEVHRREGVPIQIRLGLNSGEVVVGSVGSDLHVTYTAVGQTTHLAARMEQMARPGTVMLTGQTLALAEGYIVVQPLGPRAIKGLDHPVEMFELVTASPARSRLHAVAVRGLTRFVGRDAEVEQLGHALSQAAGGHGQVVAVVGEPGVGKSRLWWEFARSHRTAGWLVLSTASVSYGKATAYLPLIDLLRGFFGVEARDDARRIREKLTGKLLSLDRQLEPLLAPLGWLLDLPDEDPEWTRLEPLRRRQRTLDAIKRLLLRESQVQPILVVLEDLHWIDAETQALLDALVESLPTARLLLLVNYRPEYRHGWGGKTYYRQLRIDPLAAENAEALLEALLGTDPGLQPLKRLLIERTEGNPFFLEETVRTLVEAGLLAGEPGMRRLAKPTSGLDVPATVQAVLGARIDRLSPGEKRLLQAAAVIGKDVPFGLLEAVADLPDEELRSTLGRLQAAEFLYEGRLFPDVEYTFKHALTQSVAYQSLLKSARQQHHATIARAIRVRFTEMADTQPELLAHHLTEAGDADTAVTYWHRAGERSIARSAVEEAIAQLGKALELLATLPATMERDRREAPLQLALGSALVVARGYSAAGIQDVFARARALSEALGDERGAFDAIEGLWVFHYVAAELSLARALAEELSALASRLDTPRRMAAHAALGCTFFSLGMFADAQREQEAAVRLHDPEAAPAISAWGTEPGLIARAYLAGIYGRIGCPDRGLETARELLAIAQRQGQAFGLVWAHQALTFALFQQGQVEATLQHAEAWVRLAEEHGFAQWRAQGLLRRGSVLTFLNRMEEGREQLREALEARAKTGARLALPGFLGILADACRRAERIDEGLRAVTDGLDLAALTGDRDYEASLLRIRGDLLVRRAEEEPDAMGRGEAAFHEALAVARRQGARWTELQAATSLARLWHRQGKRGEARAVLESAYSSITEGFDTPDMKAARALLDELGEANA